MSVITTAEAAAYLNIAHPERFNGLQSVIDAAEAVIAQHCGPLVATATTSRVTGCTYGLVLPITPVISLTSVTPFGGTALNLSDLYLVTSAGTVTYSAGSRFGARLYDVIYSAGRTTCPEDLKLAIKELVRHLWQTQRGPTRRPGSEPSDAAANTVPGAAYLLPFRVSELMGPHRLLPGFA